MKKTASFLVEKGLALRSLATKGFTLIELLVVISIIGILATLVMANFVGVRERARDAQRKADVNQLQKALELYKNSQSSLAYPAALASLVPTYIKESPHDPRYDASDPTVWPDYAYTRDPGGTGDNLTYKLLACLENASDPQKDTTKDASCTKASYTRTEP